MSLRLASILNWIGFDFIGGGGKVSEVRLRGKRFL